MKTSARSYVYAPIDAASWRPIATAPRGVMLLFCSMSPTIQARDWAWTDWISDRGMTLRPNGLATHWMPLPAPPMDEAQDSQQPQAV